MAAIDRLKTAIVALQTNHGEVATAADKAIQAIDALRNGENPEIDAAIASVETVSSSLLGLSNRLNVAANPPVPPPVVENP